VKPLDRLRADEARRLVGLLFDLDDTFLDRGRLDEGAYAALAALARSGLRLVAVTGRPAGWGEVLVRQWPIDGFIAENGAVWLWREGELVRSWEEVDEAGRRARRVRLAGMLDSLRSRFAQARPTTDLEARRSDLTLDIGESQRVPAEVVRAMEQAAHALGARTFISTVHLHLTLDTHDKASGAVAFLAHRFGEDVTAARARYAYAGDSANDASAFAAFRTSIGVANVVASLPRLSLPPAYVSLRPRAAGFVEIASRLLDLRAQESC
jgi:HAD superfamily hydrolase (TIGR01484 family)